MSIARSVLRRSVAAGVCTLSVISGFVLVFRMGASEVVPSVPTVELAAFLALMALPGLCLWAFSAMRAAQSEAVQVKSVLVETSMAERPGATAAQAEQLTEQDRRADRSNPAPQSDALEEGGLDQDWPEHDAHARPAAERHRRRAEAGGRRESASVRRAG